MAALAGCGGAPDGAGGGEESDAGPAPGAGSGGGATGAAGSGGALSPAAGSGGSFVPADDLPPAGNADGRCEIPAEARAEDVSKPDHVVGTGTPESCTSAAFVAAVAQGGVITFDCGPKPVVIELEETAKIYNDRGPKIVIDGGGKVTLSGRDQRRILYQNTCDQQLKWTTSHCDDQDHPQLTV